MQDGLIYSSDTDPGITRHRHGRGFTYRAPDGTTIARGAERARLEALGVPPAYEDVWMCPLPNGHLQATGRDTRARKQYRYHPDWSAQRALTKFDRLAAFGHSLPRIRRRVRRDLQEEPGEHSFALASAITLIDRLSLRVGNPEYTRDNGSYGALTLRNRHLRMTQQGLQLNFIAKGGKRVRRTIGDRTLQRLLEQIDDLPGGTLLSWLDDDGQPQRISSAQLNDYLCDAAGEEALTSKTFRTWAGTVAAYEVARAGNATIKDMATAAAERLHNTRAVARSSYIHPDVIALAGEEVVENAPMELDGLFAAEKRLMGFLEG